MYAIIETGGKQYKVSEGDVFTCDLLEAEVGSEVTFDKIILGSKGGDSVAVGAPTVADASVTGKVLRQGKDKKILVFKYKPKKRVRKLTGHRQRFAQIQITKISLP